MPETNRHELMNRSADEMEEMSERAKDLIKEIRAAISELSSRISRLERSAGIKPNLKTIK